MLMSAAGALYIVAIVFVQRVFESATRELGLLAGEDDIYRSNQQRIFYRLFCRSFKSLAGIAHSDDYLCISWFKCWTYIYFC